MNKWGVMVHKDHVCTWIIMRRILRHAVHVMSSREGWYWLMVILRVGRHRILSRVADHWIGMGRMSGAKLAMIGRRRSRRAHARGCRVV